MQTRLKCFKTGAGGPTEYGNGTWAIIAGGELLEQLSGYQFLRKAFSMELTYVYTNVSSLTCTIYEPIDE
jgi:hypothetical protein